MTLAQRPLHTHFAIVSTLQIENNLVLESRCKAGQIYLSGKPHLSKMNVSMHCMIECFSVNH